MLIGLDLTKFSLPSLLEHHSLVIRFTIFPSELLGVTHTALAMLDVLGV